MHRRITDKSKCSPGLLTACSPFTHELHAAVFLFLYFLFLFFTKIFFQFGNLQKYTPAAPLPGGRDLAARQPGGRGLSEKKDDKKLQTGP